MVVRLRPWPKRAARWMPRSTRPRRSWRGRSWPKTRSLPALLILARANYQLGKPDLAAAIVGMAQQVDEQNGEAQLLLGLLALANGRTTLMPRASLPPRRSVEPPSLIPTSGSPGTTWRRSICRPKL